MLGHLQTISQSAVSQRRTVSYTFDPSQDGGAASSRLTAITGALNHTTTFTYDPNLSGRVVRQTFPNGRFIQFQYDDNGNLTGVTPPQKPIHLFDFDAVDLLDAYTPPLTDNRLDGVLLCNANCPVEGMEDTYGTDFIYIPTSHVDTRLPAQ